MANEVEGLRIALIVTGEDNGAKASHIFTVKWSADAVERVQKDFGMSLRADVKTCMVSALRAEIPAAVDAILDTMLGPEGESDGR